ncbi:MAG: hypothetical protein FRX48_09230 [Lasallia pustulata]|uniref:Uncharacterized protein n=1 Tax=Lasallia pustulata TaxID=136370 RepID=A0A5M8PDX4_9LECA|nr:MAG: hypothetical protein FRX48_09230 [Lasallia pustulata]
MVLLMGNHQFTRLFLPKLEIPLQKTSTPISSLKRIRSCVGEEWTENPRPAKQGAADYQFSADVNSHRDTSDTPEAYDTSLLASDEAAALSPDWATISEFSTPTPARFIKKDPPPTELCFGTIVDAQIAPSMDRRGMAHVLKRLAGSVVLFLCVIELVLQPSYRLRWKK